MRWFYILGVASMVATLFADRWIDVDYRLSANISLAALAVMMTVFTVLFAARSRWRASQVGRVFLIKCVFFCLVLAQISVTVWWGEHYPWRDQIRYAIYTLGAIAYLPMLWTLWREQRRDSRE